jgi:hypothetical protein
MQDLLASVARLRCLHGRRGANASTPFEPVMALALLFVDDMRKKKLSLDRQTLQTLATDRLGGVVGGYPRSGLTCNGECSITNKSAVNCTYVSCQTNCYEP